MGNPFNRIGKLKPRRSAFDLSYRKNFTCDMGQLIPVVCDEAVPGDHFKIANQLTVRFQPLAAPIMHEISATVHYFFVPYRILWDQWEDFIVNGETDVPVPLPRMTSINPYGQLGTLWDFFGMPYLEGSAPAPEFFLPISFPWYAYNMVYNEYYRDQDLQDEVPLDNNLVLNRNWRKDYFTASRPFQQKGQSPALPVNIDTSASFSFNNLPGNDSRFIPLRLYNTGQVFRDTFLAANNATAPLTPSQIVSLSTVGASGDLLGANLNEAIARLNTVTNLNVSSTATTFDVSDLRLAVQLQKWLERNARGGTRYTEFLQSHFSVSPTDSRLQRPEYIGGTKMPIIISEVLQTSQTTSGSGGSPLAQMGGHGLAADSQFAGTYNVQEYGLIIGIMSVMPKPSYQDGINRQWLRERPTDFYFPEFAHLSEQGIYQTEIQTKGTASDKDVFGYVGQYDEMRVKHDMVCNEMRMLSTSQPQLSYWNLTRKFDSGSTVSLNSDFITCVPSKRVFAVTDVPGLIVNCQNLIKAIRPLPLIAEPGLMDHF